VNRGYKVKVSTGGFTIVSLLFFFVWIAAIVGWVWNVIKIFNLIEDPITGLFILRCVGVFAAPLGAILGYL